MNLVLLFKDDFIDDFQTVRLTGRRFEHIRKVHSVSEGDTLCIGLLDGMTGTGTLTRLDKHSLEMTVSLDTAPPDPLPVTLVLSLPRPKMLRRILFHASSLGVKRIFLINSYRVEKSFWQSPVLQADNVRKQLILGLEQARDTALPEVFLKKRFKPFVEDDIPGIIDGSRAIVAHPGVPDFCPSDINGNTTLAIGPEGGFIPYEVNMLVAAGFSPVNLGRRILRVETAVPVLLARLFTPVL